jgi:hypothetical protein
MGKVCNSEAVLTHITGVASQTILPKIFSVSRISKLDVYGNGARAVIELFVFSIS